MFHVACFVNHNQQLFTHYFSYFITLRRAVAMCKKSLSAVNLFLDQFYRHVILQCVTECDGMLDNAMGSSLRLLWHRYQNWKATERCFSSALGESLFPAPTLSFSQKEEVDQEFLEKHRFSSCQMETVCFYFPTKFGNNSVATFVLTLKLS